MPLEWVLGQAGALVSWTLGKLQALDVEPREFHLRDLSRSKNVNEIITSHPIAYLGKVQVSNGTDRRRGIKRIQLAVGGRVYPWAEQHLEPFAPGDVRTVDLVFPAETNSANAGRYELSLTDSSGRVCKVSGSLGDCMRRG